MSLEIISFEDVDSLKEAWDEVVNNTQHAWFWSTYQEHQYRLSTLKASGVLIKDSTFLLVDNNIFYGLAPLVFIRSSVFDGIQASYDKPLPWPMIVDTVNDPEKVYSFIFDEIERLIIEFNVEMLSVEYSPPYLNENDLSIYLSTIRKRKFINNSYQSHFINVTPLVLNNVRKRYRRYVNKYIDKYELSIIDSHSHYSTLPLEYMGLHVKDSGATYRPLKTYENQLKCLNYGKGFIVQAKIRDHDKVVGMLLINVFKGAAYDSSVAVDPDFQSDQISNLLKWKAIKYLQKLNIKHYDLGKAAIVPNYLWQPTEKNYGISFFKNGWSRDCYKRVWQSDKFFSKEALSSYCDNKREDIINYLAL